MRMNNYNKLQQTYGLQKSAGIASAIIARITGRKALEHGTPDEIKRKLMPLVLGLTGGGAGALAGGLIGKGTADEDATTEEKHLRASRAAILGGILGASAGGSIPAFITPAAAQTKSANFRQLVKSINHLPGRMHSPTGLANFARQADDIANPIANGVDTGGFGGVLRDLTGGVDRWKNVPYGQRLGRYDKAVDSFKQFPEAERKAYAMAGFGKRYGDDLHTRMQSRAMLNLGKPGYRTPIQVNEANIPGRMQRKFVNHINPQLVGQTDDIVNRINQGVNYM